MCYVLCSLLYMWFIIGCMSCVAFRCTCVACRRRIMSVVRCYARVVCCAVHATCCYGNVMLCVFDWCGYRVILTRVVDDTMWCMVIYMCCVSCYVRVCYCDRCVMLYVCNACC